MTEQRPFYRAFSDLPVTHASNDNVSVALSPEKHQRDIILLLPILDTPQSDEQSSVCLHLVHLPDSNLGLCSTKGLHRCPCCGNAVCDTHRSEHALFLPDVPYIGADVQRVFLCKTCAVFSTETIYAFRAFRLSINEHSVADGLVNENALPQSGATDWQVK